MRFSSLRIAMVVVAVSLMVGLAHIRADNFRWDSQPGPPQKIDNAACEQMPSCASFTCQPTNVSVVPDGGTQAVVVKSYWNHQDYKYGTCTVGQLGPCYAYPDVKCAELNIYGMAGCQLGDLLGNKTVYGGSCSLLTRV